MDEADRLLEPYRHSGAKSILLNFILIVRGHLHRAVYDYKRAEKLYLQAGRDRNGVILALRLVQSGREQEALELAKEKWLKEKKTPSPAKRAAYQGMLGTALLSREDYEQAQHHLETAAKTLEALDAINWLITVRIYLAKLYFAQGKSARAVECLRYSFGQIEARGYYDLDWWQPWVVAEMCAEAIRANIETDLVESLACKRLLPQHIDPFLPLVNHGDEAVKTKVNRILEKIGDLPGLTARLLLEKCDDEIVRKYLLKWLNDKWLTEIGLLRLREVLPWQQLAVFLASIYPPFQGDNENETNKKISKALIKSANTIKTQKKTARKKLAKNPSVLFPQGRGKAYGWAIDEGIINPQAPLPHHE